MRASMAYFAGVGTVVVAVAAGLGGGLLISNIVSPHEPKTETSKLEQRMSSKPIPVSNAPSEPVSYLAATTPVAPGPSAPATTAPQTGPANAAPTPAQPAEAQSSASVPPAASSPQTVPSVAQATNSEQIKAPENAVARASDADVRREARREARRLEQKRRVERRQQWAERRRPRPDQELLDVEAKVREETGPRQAFTAEPASLGMPRIRLYEDD
jgi:hypothetical protein